VAVDKGEKNFEHPLYDVIERMPGADVALTTLDKLMTWGYKNSLWVFPMATSCCGIEFMAAACSRFDMDRIGSIARGTPRQCDVMIVAGTITVKMAPRVFKLWEQMPEPKWCIAMGSCAISGDFYRDIYSVVPGVDTFLPVDVYVPGCPPNPDALLNGLRRLQDKIELQRTGKWVEPEIRPNAHGLREPGIPRIGGANRLPVYDEAQVFRTKNIGLGGASLDEEMRARDISPPVQIEEPSAGNEATVKAGTVAKKPAAAPKSGSVETEK
jgi:NADH-quinone oxidoreductase subunit B